ncbi:DUF1206 domain-containing protein [Mangrovimonas futianensis]|uniref:DUF1206 domain-containing protein n=1 Tax=Mangrovimonas futianensis TaxID=2895523 RepID=UPI001E3E98A6|nr:DUF1206 domain-containing protein [Mangrovimonas futianensis]MCF1422301.1 DUF1206 domain-containing protein [Mangrovimonas futianensis]
MSSHKKNFARFGMAAKGTVYCIIGILTGLAAFSNGGEKAGSTGALQFLAKQPFGQVLLILMGLGLLGYLFWRFYQVFKNPSNITSDFKGYATRIAYFISGLAYGGLAFYAFKLAIYGFIGSSNSSLTQNLFSGSYGNLIALMVGIGFAIKAIYDLYRAYSGKYRNEIRESDLSNNQQKILINAGRFGHAARGLVFGLMAFLTIKSGLNSSSSVSTQTDAFSFIESQFGALVLGVISVGLIGYGIYMFIKAKYPSITLI